MSSTVRQSKQISVTLGEAESDVLVHLVKDQPKGALAGSIVAHMRDRGVERDDAVRGVSRALRTLHTLGLVRTSGNESGIRWHSTDEGAAAVRGGVTV